MERLKNIPKRLLWLGIGFIIILVICHRLAFSETLALMTQCTELEDQIQTQTEAPARLQRLERELKQIETQLGSSNPQAPLLLLNELTHFCTDHQLILKAVPAVREESKDGINRRLQTFQVEGRFKSLVNLIHYLEKNPDVGRLISVCYRAENDLRSKRRRLIAYISVQNITLEQHET